MITKGQLSRITVGMLMVGAALFVSFPASAKVSGVCSNCHTMHNSQNGELVAPTPMVGFWISMDGATFLQGGFGFNAAKGSLLKTDCVGCHSSANTAETILNFGGSKIPIVFNIGVEPTTMLAGGNFFWVAEGMEGTDNKGHNVDFSDETFGGDIAPWAPGESRGCGCHSSLINPEARDAQSPSPEWAKPGGCQGCHVATFHHVDNGVYRFLKGHQNWDDPKDLSKGDYVVGIEDPDWEHNAGHNSYKGSSLGPPAAGTTLWNLAERQTVTAFCSACHGQFHLPGWIEGSTDGMGGPGAGTWIRHPSDIAIPTTGEYAGFNPVDNYSKEVPVGWDNPAAPTRETAVVMCLSCHRAHGSPYPSSLRWDYRQTIANTTGAGAGKGCFVCHTAKDGKD